MLSEKAVDRGYRLVRFEAIGSTNEEGLARARQGETGRLWLVADRQTQGRGRSGRAWDSPQGNLHASLLLRDAAPPRVAPQLGFVAGVALWEAVTRVTGSRQGLAIKWPNDLLLDGAKVAGILIESTTCADGGFACVVGFGVNCRTYPTGLPYRATSLAAVHGAAVTRDRILAALSETIIEGLDAWRAGADFGAVRRAWMDRAIGRGTPLGVFQNDRRIEGCFGGIDEDGRLLLDTAHGVATIQAADVFLNSDRSPARSGRGEP